jgi:hypothetical protein
MFYVRLILFSLLVFVLLFLRCRKFFTPVNSLIFLKHHFCFIRYIATVDGLVHKRYLMAISEGTVIEGVHCVPDSVELLPHMPNVQRARLRIVVNIYVFDLLYKFYHPTWYLTGYEFLITTFLFVKKKITTFFDIIYLF